MVERLDLSTSELDYPLDESLIATRPANPRDSARMLVYFRREDRIEHRRVRDLPEYLVAGSTMVVNDTRVEPLRFVARRLRDGRETEGLFVESRGEGRWAILLKGARRFRDKDTLELIAPGVETGRGDMIEVERNAQGEWEARFVSEGSAEAAWMRSGRTPLPPYILKARKVRRDGDADDSADRHDYQTVYAWERAIGHGLPSCAAPTAGLHFTKELLEAVARKGVTIASVELQVGSGTFKPVESARLIDHPMHRERCRILAGGLIALAASNPALSLVVGTTSVRVLETIGWPISADLALAARQAIAAGDPMSVVAEFDTRLLISPGYEFHWTSRLLTNFHLPRSTLLALVGALVGLDRLKALYQEAQREGYRFYSLGDAMLILP